jgi:AcrR family transcriptional regulator
MSTPIRFEDLPLRQRKFAQTKLGLLHAALHAIRTQPFESVPVRDLCRVVSISEASFFNYFPRKADILTYYVQLWSLEMAWHAAATSAGGLAAIEEIFERTARQVAGNPAPMGEIIAGQAVNPLPPAFAEITLAERLLAFPDLDGIERLDGKGLGELLPPLIRRAIRAGELPRRTDRRAAVLALASTFLGLPVVLRAAPAGAIGPAYRAQLRLVWAGLRATPRPPSTRARS